MFKTLGARGRRAAVTAALIAAGTVAGGLLTTPSPANAAASGSSIVQIAQRELNDDTRNYEVGTNCSYYGGVEFGWPACGGKPGWGGGTSAYAWCAAFAKYVWSQAGVTEGMSDINGMAASFKSYGQSQGTWHARGSYVPQPGDAVVFDWDHDGTIDHVGIVTSTSGSTMYDISGNFNDAVQAATYANYASDADIVGFTTAAGLGAPVTGTASVYGILSDGRMTYTPIDVATGNRISGYPVTSTATLGFTPKAMATLDFNTVFVTGTDGHLYRVDIGTNKTSLTFSAPVDLGAGWGSFDMLAFDGSHHLYGIIKSTGTLRRYDVQMPKPTAADITNYTTIDTGFGTIDTLTTTGTDWLLCTASDGRLLSYHISGPSDWTSYALANSGWGGPTVLMSPGSGVIFANFGTAMYHYLDTNPYDGSGSDLQFFLNDPVDTSGWTQTLLSAQPASI